MPVAGRRDFSSLKRATRERAPELNKRFGARHDANCGTATRAPIKKGGSLLIKIPRGRRFSQVPTARVSRPLPSRSKCRRLSSRFLSLTFFFT